MLGTYHLNALFEILSKIHFIYEPEQLWDFILEQACRTLQSEASTYFEYSEESKQLQVQASYGIGKESLSMLPFTVGVGISGWVAEFQQPALVNDVRHDHRFNGNVDLITGFETRSILCIPVSSMKRVYGVLEVINRKEGPFTPQDQEFMTLLGRQAAIAYQNLNLLEEVQHKETLLESLLESLSGGLVAMDASETVTVLNPACARLLALSGDRWVGKPAAVVLKDVPWFLERLREIRSGGPTASRQEASLTLHGQAQRIGYSTILISNAGKQILGSGIIFQRLS
jgi:GAF domain-containing protein